MCGVGEAIGLDPNSNTVTSDACCYMWVKGKKGHYSCRILGRGEINLTTAAKCSLAHPCTNRPFKCTEEDCDKFVWTYISKNCCHSTCYIFPMFFNMLFFFQHAVFFFNMLFFSCMIFNMLFFAGPFFNMLFHVFNMLFFSAPISTCYFFNMLFLHMTFQHAKFCKTIFEHAIFYFNCNVGMVNPAWGMSVDYLRGRVGAKYLGSSPISVHPWCHGHGCFITAAVPSKELMLTT